MQTIFKRVGETPLEAVNRFKKEKPKYKNEKVSYAGRLDPMAEGELLLLIGDENKKRREYENYDKIYDVEFLPGIMTDSFDILGLILNKKKALSKLEIRDYFKKLIGEHTQKLPVYSSYRVKGKPLFWWAKNNKLDEIKIPINKINIYEAKLLSFKKIKSKTLHSKIISSIDKVNGDFRQEEIISNWNEYFKNNSEDLIVATAKIKCSSGTYIRSIVNEMGSTALKIDRLRILQSN